MKTRNLIALALILLTVLSACGEPSATSPTPSTASPSTTPTTSPSPSIAPPPISTNFDLEPADKFVYEYDTEYAGVKLTQYLGDKTQLRVPDEIEGFPVIGIENMCFAVDVVTDVQYPATLKFFRWGGNIKHNLSGELRIPYGVSEIVRILDNYWDDAIKNVTSVDIPNSVTIIGECAFRHFTSLETVILPDSVTAIGEYAFEECKSLRTINIPNGVTKIDVGAFESCSSLTAIYLPDGLTELGTGAFYNCISLLKIEIPDSFVTAGAALFVGTSWYKTQTDGVVYAGKVACGYKGEMPSNTVITLVAGTKGIALEAFTGQETLVDIMIPDSVTTIGWSAFVDCGSLSEESKTRIRQIDSDVEFEI
ncbi:hypothetical protein FACS1894217_12490 [Clostridia bacterium]|nr:hypothetical protein FACS1894217_12490 [Clostridia bacterium]